MKEKMFLKLTKWENKQQLPCSQLLILMIMDKVKIKKLILD